MLQPSLFTESSGRPEPKRQGDLPERLTVLITVKAAPNPSDKYGETVCVAGLRIDMEHLGWVRLYPLNFRELAKTDSFDKYEVIELEARPARQGDTREESWRPNWESITRSHRKLDNWSKRRPWIDEHIENSMCRLYQAAKLNNRAKSLALVRPKKVDGIVIAPHPGWTADEHRKIAKYLQQLPLTERHYRPTPLEAPRFKAWYRYHCHEPHCNGHKQQLLDWELVALQRRLSGSNDRDLKDAIRAKFFGQMCADNRDVAFYVGNQAKRATTFSTLGVYYPKRS